MATETVFPETAVDDVFPETVPVYDDDEEEVENPAAADAEVPAPADAEVPAPADAEEVPAPADAEGGPAPADAEEVPAAADAEVPAAAEPGESAKPKQARHAQMECGICLNLCNVKCPAFMPACLHGPFHPLCLIQSLHVSW